MITAEQIATALKKTAEEVTAPLAAVDQAALEAEVSSQVSVSVWDKASPINGHPASIWLTRPDVNPAAAIYVIMDGDHTYFQPHAPGVSGFVWMTDEDVEGYATAHRNELIADRLLEWVVAAVRTSLVPA